MEQWKDIKGYEGIYMISDQGRVKSLIGNEKILKPKTSKLGYCWVGLRKDKNTKHYTIHRLVAINFLDNPENKPQVNHINGIKTDNRLSNLEWNTSRENVNHSYDNGLRDNRGSKNGKSKLTEQQVLDIRQSNLTNKELSKIYSVRPNLISRIKTRKIWNHI